MTGSELQKQLEANVVSIYGSAFVAELRELNRTRFDHPRIGVGNDITYESEEDIARQAATYATQVTARYLDLARKEYPEAFVK